MFRVGDTIMYGTQGVCRIEEIAEKDLMGSKRKYYVLKPLSNPGTTLFAPVNNEKTDSKMRKVLSRQEIMRLLSSLPDDEVSWIRDERERKEEYKRIIAGGDHVELIRMIWAICIHKEEREADGKHLYLSDERFFKEAERLLYDEFHYVLDIKREELLPMILEKIGGKSKSG